MTTNHSKYDTPEAVLQDKKLSKEEKIKILTEWADYEKQKSTAGAENMPHDTSEEDDKLRKVIDALHSLGANFGNVD